MASKISPTVEYTGVPNGGIPIATAGVMMVPMVQPTPQPISQPIQANINSYYGNHIALQTASYGEVKLLYKAEFDYYMCTCCSNPFLASCCIDRSRTYFYIYENAYEYNSPSLCLQCCCVVGGDSIRKNYFDRGIFDQQGCLRAIQCIRGAPSVHSGNVQFVCCCQDCSECGNDCLNGYWPGMCGDRVRVLPADAICFCCPTRSCWLNNYCGLCGPKDGEPLILFPFVASLRIGTGEQFVAQLESARANWTSRTGQK